MSLLNYILFVSCSSSHQILAIGDATDLVPFISVSRRVTSHSAERNRQSFPAIFSPTHAESIPQLAVTCLQSRRGTPRLRHPQRSFRPHRSSAAVRVRCACVLAVQSQQDFGGRLLRQRDGIMESGRTGKVWSFPMFPVRIRHFGPTFLPAALG